MPHTAIYGASDDLIEVSGAFSEEYSAYGDPRHVTVELEASQTLSFVVGFVDHGIWRIASIHPTDGAAFSLHSAREAVDSSADGDDEDGCPAYSEKLIVHGRVLAVEVRKATAAEVLAAFPRPNQG